MNKYSGAPPVPWLVASATNSMNFGREIRVELNTPGKVTEVLLSLPEVEAAVRRLMQAHADAIGKSLSFCVYPRK